MNMFFFSSFRLASDGPDAFIVAGFNPNYCVLYVDMSNPFLTPQLINNTLPAEG